jgi:hypothetical protein
MASIERVLHWSRLLGKVEGARAYYGEHFGDHMSDAKFKTWDLEMNFRGVWIIRLQVLS